MNSKAQLAAKQFHTLLEENERVLLLGQSVPSHTGWVILIVAFALPLVTISAVCAVMEGGCGWQPFWIVMGVLILVSSFCYFKEESGKHWFALTDFRLLQLQRGVTIKLCGRSDVERYEINGVTATLVIDRSAAPAARKFKNGRLVIRHERGCP
ncbi:MAG: hypothetical protein ACRD3W_04160 [Terriglobales bacterium]